MLVIGTLIMSLLFTGAMAFGNPSMLPKHPGYPMGEFKDPVWGVPTANDPGQQAPSPNEAIEQAAAFHDAYVTNPVKEIRPNIVHDFNISDGNSSTDEKTS